MGVPGLFAYCLKKFKSSNINLKSLNKSIDFLFIDGNGFIYNAVSQVLTKDLIIDENKKLPNNLASFFKEIITINKKQHTSTKKAHQELTSMEHLDDDVEKIFKEKELILTDKLYNLFLNNGYRKKNLKEKIHIIVNLIDSLAHEEAYHKHPNFDYDKMEEIVIKMIIDTLKDSQ